MRIWSKVTQFFRRRRLVKYRLPGIFPIKNSWVSRLHTGDELCIYCGCNACNHWVSLYQREIHGFCVPPFLTTLQGRKIIERNESIIVAEE